MTPVIPCSASIALSFGTTSVSRGNYHLTRCRFLVKSERQTLSSQLFLLPLSVSVKLSPKYSNDCAAQSRLRNPSLAATRTGLTIEEQHSAVADEKSDGSTIVQTNAVETGEAPLSTADATFTPSDKSKPQRTMRKSEFPSVKNEELVSGATFTGKVRSIQPFGAFVEFGAFTDGLVHVSQLSNSYVKDIHSVVSVGQEVKVRVVEANIETGRIALSMRGFDNSGQLHQHNAPGSRNDKPIPGGGATTNSRQNGDMVQKNSKCVKGQDLQGTVKSLTRVGAFISLPEGEEGFLPTSEESDEEFANMIGGSVLQVGQEVSVRVLRISRGGQVTLTMKKQEEAEGLNSKLVQGVVHAATNPFALAFRNNKDVVPLLAATKKVQKTTKLSVVQNSSEEIKGEVAATESMS